MAGDWIKLEKDTIGKPEISRLYKILGVTREHAFGLCIRFWIWCDSHLTDGFLEGQGTIDIDDEVRHEGFAAALIEVGWLLHGEGILSVPNFERHLSKSAKRRGEAARSMSKMRAKNPVNKKRNIRATSSQQNDHQRREEKS